MSTHGPEEALDGALEHVLGNTWGAHALEVHSALKDRGYVIQKMTRDQWAFHVVSTTPEVV